MPMIDVILTRDSVCASDDSEAPHELLVRVESLADPEILVRRTATGYLPSVAGIGHMWSCHLNNMKIAEITTDGVQALVSSVEFDETNRIHFVYHSAMY